MCLRIRFAFALSLALLLGGTSLHAQAPKSPPSAVQPMTAISSIVAQAQADVAAKRFADAVALIQAQPTVKTDSGLRHALADAQYAWAQDLMAQFQYAQAIPHDQACYDLDKGDRIPQSGDDLGNLGLAHYDLSQYPQALDCSRQALAIHRRTGDRAGQARDLNNLGNVFSYTNRPAQALDCYRQALPLERQTQEKAGEAATLNGIGNCDLSLSRYRQARTAFQQELAIETQLGDRKDEAITLNNLGQACDSLSQYPQAIDFDAQALPLERQAQDDANEAVTLNNIGVVYKERGRYAQALEYYQQSLAIQAKLGDKAGAAATLNNIGMADLGLSRFAVALTDFQEAEALKRQVGDEEGEAVTLNNLGGVYDNLGQPARALGLYQQALPLYRRMGDRAGEALALNNVGRDDADLGQPVQALGCYQQALPLERQAGNRDYEAATLSNIGLAYDALHQYDRAIGSYGQALSVERQIGVRDREALTLSHLGLTYSHAGRFGRALGLYEQALPLLREVRDRTGEAAALGGLMRACRSVHETGPAIFYGKQSVNVYQGIRAGLQAMDTQTQQTYLASVSDTYRTLADLLIGQGRLPEAEQVLDMLKRQEQSEYLRGPETLPGVPGQVDLTPTESAQEQQYQQIADQVTALGRQQQALLDEKKQGAALPPADQTRLDDTTLKLAAADAHLSLFLGRLTAVFGGATPGEKSLQTRLAAINDAGGLQDTLRQLHEQGQDVVVLETLVAPDRFAVIVTTAASQKVEQFPITAADFNKKVAALQAALRDPDADPTGAALALYQVVFAPLEKDLAQARARTLMWSLDGSLRYVPVAALYDGHQYLVERFDSEVFTLGSQTGLGGDEHKTWNALGLGVTEAHAVSDPATGQALQFPALGSVSDELHGVVRDAAHPGGALPGALLLDPQFTQQTMTGDLQSQRYNVVHIASHFALHPGDPAASFLLLGDGSAWSLADISHQRTLFAGVDLLALSACDTASGGTGGDGREVDSLGSVAQKDGAKSVLASLWPVADASTRLLMETFYRRHETHPGDNKAEALRQAQLSLLRGTASAPAAPTRGTSLGDAPPPNADAPPFTPDPKAPYAHPYYWAPFVLLGNWR